MYAKCIYILPGVTPTVLGTKIGALTLSAETDETIAEFELGDWICIFELLLPKNFNIFFCMEWEILSILFSYKIQNVVAYFSGLPCGEGLTLLLSL